MVSVEINVHDNASIVVIVLKIWWCPLRLLLRMMILMLKLSLHNDAFSKYSLPLLLTFDYVLRLLLFGTFELTMSKPVKV